MPKKLPGFQTSTIRGNAFGGSTCQLYLWLTAVTLSVVGFAVGLTGCMKTGLPSASQYKLIRSGKLAIVLLRVTSEIDGEPHEAFGDNNVPGNHISLALGGFETAGERSHIWPWFLSDRSRKDGWLYFPLEPGTYYLAVQKPFLSTGGGNIPLWEAGLKHAPMWRFDVPLNSKLVYLGTLHIPCKAEGKSSMGDGKIISFTDDSVVVRNEEPEASRLAAEYLPELGIPKTMLIERHEGPIILESPGVSTREP